VRRPSEWTTPTPGHNQHSSSAETAPVHHHMRPALDSRAPLARGSPRLTGEGGWVAAVRQGRGKKLPASAARYALHVTTGDALQGGSAGRVTVTLHGARTTGAALVLTQERSASTHETLFARGQTDTFRVDQQVQHRGEYMREATGRARVWSACGCV